MGRVLNAHRELAANAESVFQQATDLDPKSAAAWANLGNFLRLLEPGRGAQAETALRKAIDLDPRYVFAWASLGTLLRQMPGRREEAETAFRQAIEVNPKYVYAWASLGELLQLIPGRREEAEAALRKVIEMDPKNAWACVALGNFLGKTTGRLHEAEAAFGKALEIDPGSSSVWNAFGFFLACHARQPSRAEAALRKAVEIDPDDTGTLRNLGLLLFCETDKAEEGIQYLRRARQPNASDWISPAVATAILAACIGGSGTTADLLPSFLIDSKKVSFWYELLELGRNYAPFGKILLRLCDLIAETDSSNAMARLHRAVALAQLRDFPRAAVALEDALVGDPIELLSWGRKALEVFFAAAVESGRVRDCLEVIEKKEWIDAWRPIYEALKAVEAGSGDYLKRVAVEIREPAQIILRQIAPELPGLVIPNN